MSKSKSKAVGISKPMEYLYRGCVATISQDDTWKYYQVNDAEHMFCEHGDNIMEVMDLYDDFIDEVLLLEDHDKIVKLEEDVRLEGVARHDQYRELEKRVDILHKLYEQLSDRHDHLKANYEIYIDKMRYHLDKKADKRRSILDWLRGN